MSLSSKPPSRKRRLSPAGVAALYAIFAVLWIVLSGALLTLNVDDPGLQARIEMGKGGLFVLVTSLLLYFILRQWHDSAALPEGTAAAEFTLNPMQALKWRWRILGFLALAGLVPLAGFIVVKMHGPQMEREAFANLEAVAELKASQIERWLDERYNDGEVIAATPGLIQAVASLQQTTDATLQNERLGEIRQAMSVVSTHKYNGGLLVDPAGKVLTSMGQTPRLSRLVIDQLEAALNSRLMQFSEISLDEEGRLHLSFIVPLVWYEDGGQQAVGALILNETAERFLQPFLKHWPTASASGETLLIRRDGDNVSFINEPRYGTNGALSFKVPLRQSRLLADIALNQGRLGSQSTGEDYRGVPVLAAYRPVAGTDWVVVAKLDREEVMKPATTLAFWVSLITLLSISTVGVVMLMLWHQRGRTLRLEMQAHSDKLIRQFYDMPFIGIGMSSPESLRWFNCNEHLCTLLGYSREELLGLNGLDLTHPDDVAVTVAKVDQLLKGKKGEAAGDEADGFTLEKRFIRKDGRTIFVLLDVKCVRRADGSPDYLLSTIQDISERKQAEARILRLTQFYAALSECNQAIVRCTSEAELFPLICRIAVQFAGMKMAWVGTVNPETSQVKPVASYGDEAGYLENVEISVDAASPYGQGAVGQSLRDREPVWIQDYCADPRTAVWCDYARGAGWRAAAALPLYRNEKIVGTFALIAGEVNAFGDEERNLLVEMAVDISFALTAFAKDAERRHMEAELRESESRFRDLYEKAPLAYQSLDVSGNIVEVNEAWLSLLGRTRAEVIGRFVGDFMEDLSLKTLEKEFPQFQLRGRVDGPLFNFRHKDGSRRLLMVNGQISRDREGNFLRTHCILTDLTERMQAEEQLRLSAKVFEQSAEGVVVTDVGQNILMVNRAFSAITGYSADEAIGQTPRLLASGYHDQHFFAAVWATVNTAGYWQGELWNRRKSGEIYPELVSISRVLDDEGAVSHYVGIFSDISEQKESQAHIQRLAYYDSLTGLPNRRLLEDRVGQALARDERHHQSLALVFLDLDRFKNVNDSLGHRVGDQLLVQVAERLRHQLRDEDTVSRLGGDEFILVLPDTDVAGAVHVAEKIARALALPCQIDQHELSITASLGIAMYPADGTSYEALSMSADAAMFRAKQEGRNTFRFFTREMQERSDRTLQLENALRRALELDQFQLYYQPQLSLKDNRIVGAEALIRWRHHELGMVSPADFIPIAEESGMILPIGEWVLRTAIGQMKAWQEGGLPSLVMAVNLSAVQFRQTDLPERVSSLLDEYRLSPACLELELTEGVAMDNPQAAIELMNDLYARGVRMAIDDFGTGYSSLSYLKRFKAYKLKIDQSFVRDISNDPDDEAIVGAIIGLSQSLGLRTIAEGVETAEQLAFLRGKGCDEVQGYYLAKPMPAAEFEAFVRARG